MVIIERKLLFLRDKLVFYPSQKELEELIKNLGNFEFLKVKETDVVLSEDRSFLINRGEFRTAFIDLRKDLDDIWKEMDKSSCRYEINKAKKWEDKIEITINQKPDVFLKLYNDFVKKKKHIFPLSKNRLADYLGVSDFFLCYLDKTPLVGHLLLRDDKEKIVRLMFSTSKRLDSKDYDKLTGPLNRYLHWYEFGYYKKHGIEIYDMGGIGSGKGKVGRFKLTLGGKKVKMNSYVFGKVFIKTALRIYGFFQRIRSKIFLKE